MVRTGRPKKDRIGKTRSIYFSPESEEVLAETGYQTNLSDFINGLIRYACENSPVLMALKIERLGKEIITIEERLLSLRAERDILQAQLNLYKQRGSADDQHRNDARMDLLRKWEIVGSQGVGMFTNWLTGPANSHLTRDAGSASADEAADWCRAEAVRR